MQNVTVGAGANVNVKGSQNVSIQAAGNATIRGAGTTAITGSNVTINDGGCHAAARVGDATVRVAGSEGGAVPGTIVTGSNTVCIG